MTRVALILVVVALVSACQGPVLTRDDRVAIVTPAQDATVSVPVTLRWRASDLRTSDPGAPGDGRYYAVFVDRPPLGPGQSLLSLVERECAVAGHGCANRAYFEQRNVYLTGKTALRLTSIPPMTTHRKEARLHTVTIVLMDGHNRRVGEAAWQRSFRVVGT